MLPVGRLQLLAPLIFTAVAACFYLIPAVFVNLSPGEWPLASLAYFAWQIFLLHSPGHWNIIARRKPAETVADLLYGEQGRLHGEGRTIKGAPWALEPGPHALITSTLGALLPAGGSAEMAPLEPRIP